MTKKSACLLTGLLLAVSITGIDAGEIHSACILTPDAAKVAEILKAGREKIDDLDETGHSAMHFAARYGFNDCLEVMFSYGASPDIASRDGETPAFEAARNGHLQTLKFLESKGANLAFRNPKNNRGLLHAAAVESQVEVMDYLLKKGFSSSDRDKNDDTPLYMVALGSFDDSQKQVEAARLLLKSGAKVDEASSGGTTPLIMACGNKNLSFIRFLLENGANVNWRDNDGGTALHFACLTDNGEVIKLLISHGAQVNMPDNNYWLPIHSVAAQGNVALAEILFKAGAKLDALTHKGLSPLHLARKRNHLEMIDFLQKHLNK